MSIMSLLTYLRLKTTAAILRSLIPFTMGAMPPLHNDSVIEIPSREQGGTIKAHIYLPSNPSNRQNPSPVLINFYGSGFVMPLYGSDDYFCRFIADHASYTVIDVAYRRAPEHPFPAAPQDAEDVVKYVLSQPAEYDLQRFSISGFSSGGNLALGLATSSAFPEGTFRALLVYYPPTDLSILPDKKIAPDTTGHPIPPRGLQFFHEAYLQGHDPADPLVSPGLAKDLSGVPRNVLVVTCACDSLAPETEALADRIEREKGGRRVIRKRVAGVDHAWDKLCKEDTDGWTKREEVYGLAIELLKR